MVLSNKTLQLCNITESSLRVVVEMKKMRTCGSLSDKNELTGSETERQNNRTVLRFKGQGIEADWFTEGRQKHCTRVTMAEFHIMGKTR